MIQCIRGEAVYCRSTSLEAEALCKSLAEAHGGPCFCHLASSGMNAIVTVLTAYLNKHLSQRTRIVISDELFSKTPSVARHLCDLYGARLETVNVEDPASLTKTICEAADVEVTIFLVESCSNPSGKVFDLRRLPTLRKQAKGVLYVVVDNTWLTHAVLNPLEYPGVDVVVTSLTKYYSAGTCIAGAIVARDEKQSQLFGKQLNMTGIHVPPASCRTISARLLGLESRVETSSRAAVTAIQALDRGGMQIRHPFLATHPSHPVAKALFKKSRDDDGEKSTLYPSVFAFVYPGDKAVAQRWMNSIPSIAKKTSFGAAETRFDTYPKVLKSDGGGGLPGHRATGAKNTLCRLSVGYRSEPKEIVDAILPHLPASSSSAK